MGGSTVHFYTQENPAKRRQYWVYQAAQLRKYKKTLQAASFEFNVKREQSIFKKF